MANEADAVTLDAGLVYEAGLAPYSLKPVVAEFYGSKEKPQTSYYAVAVVKKGSGFQLNQLRGKKSVTDSETCHLARAPNHAVVSREDKAGCVNQILLEQQAQYGKNGTKCLDNFCLFHSETKDLLFRDDTLCLAKLPDKVTYKSYLGAEYVTAVGNLRQCSTSKLLEACTFHRV
uniref:Transferrin n=1 Tax=Rousettus aegyptiacus TaxID=9407 RepID=A0A7J8HW11_ROUAE|nr:transferrin [Rousettus aegyptiacus]